MAEVTLYVVGRRGSHLRMFEVRAHKGPELYRLDSDDAYQAGLVNTRVPKDNKGGLAETPEAAVTWYANRCLESVQDAEKFLERMRALLTEAQEFVEDVVRKVEPDLTGVFSEKSGGDHV